jgi:putative ABC transport system permease protein
VYPEGTAIADADKGFRFFYNTVGRDYFRTMGMPLLAGREFTVEDDSAAARVAVVSRALADRFWPNEPVMGRRFRFGKDGPMVEIVGVAADAQYLNLGEPPRPFVYLPASQFYTPRITLVVHTAVDPTSLARGVRDIVSALDRELAVFDVRTMEDHLQNGRALLFVRLGALFAAAFGALTLALAALGVYGVMSYSVTQRTKEIGIRVALGARLSSVLGLVLGEGMRIVVLGLVLGLVAAVAVARLLSGLLYGVRVSDPVVFGGVAIGLGVVALAASYLPARRAAKVDPLVALRAE